MCARRIDCHIGASCKVTFPAFTINGTRPIGRLVREVKLDRWLIEWPDGHLSEHHRQRLDIVKETMQNKQ